MVGLMTKINNLDERYDALLDDAFSRRIDELMLASDGVENAKAVSPEAKHKLRGILKHYAKERHPFTACVRDNTKRFGKDRAERICAVVKDIIWGTTKWRGKGDKSGEGPHPYTGMSEAIEIDDETAGLIDTLSELDLGELLGLAVADEEK